ncbi:MAG: hypothetical protein HY611_03275 [Elusimicrobia bacterium]|nr:hypothetical protein [Elusimicrobiota bacterium]
MHTASQDIKELIRLTGARACPPEDCGGIGGYEDLLAALRDPKHNHREFALFAGRG